MGLFGFLGRQGPRIERLKERRIVQDYPAVNKDILAESAMLQRAFNVLGEGKSGEISEHFRKAREAFLIFERELELIEDRERKVQHILLSPRLSPLQAQSVNQKLAEINAAISIAAKELKNIYGHIEKAKQPLGSELHVHRTALPLLYTLGAGDSRIGGELQRVQQNMAVRVAKGAAAKILQALSKERAVAAGIAGEIGKCIASNNSVLETVPHEADLINSVEAELRIVDQNFRAFKTQKLQADKLSSQLAQLVALSARLRESCKALFDAEKRRGDAEKDLLESLNKIRAGINVLMVS